MEDFGRILVWVIVGAILLTFAPGIFFFLVVGLNSLFN
jgi:hypothetical protein